MLHQLAQIPRAIDETATEFVSTAGSEPDRRLTAQIGGIGRTGSVEAIEKLLDFGRFSLDARFERIIVKRGVDLAGMA